MLITYNPLDVELKIMDIVKEYIRHMGKKITFEEFFDKCGVPENQRSDFVIGCMVKQAEEMIENNPGIIDRLQKDLPDYLL